MNPLQLRLAALRRRLRRVVTFRGLSVILAIVLFALAVGGALDWLCYSHQIRLPALVRALVLTGTVGLAGLLGYRLLFRPLGAPADDLSLALRVEARYPLFNDALASAVQFLEQAGDSDQTGSPSLRQEAVTRALAKAKRVDFNPIVDTHGVRAASLSLVAAAVLALGLGLAYPQRARTAFLRLADPFGGHAWPPQTLLNIQFPSRTARGEAFEIQASVHGQIPARATIQYHFAGSPPIEQVYEILQAEDALEGSLVARLEPARVQRSFRFQVRANDALSGWQEVEVLPPPQLAPLAGRPTPQIHLDYPQYTDLPAQDLPDGATRIEIPAGTRVILRAATSRPIARAWLEYPAEVGSALTIAAALSSVYQPSPLRFMDLARGDATAWKRITARVEPGGQVFSLEFVARVSGTFVLHFEDEMGLGNSRLIELHTVIDPAPTVHLERPSRSHDSFDVLPDAEVSLQVVAEDPLYAIRSVYVESRRKSGDSAESTIDSGRRLPLYDHAAFGKGLPALLSLSAFPVPAPPLKLRPARLETGRRLSLKELQLKEGDILTLQACADDFDDVTLDKQPGRSHEIELHVVGRTALDIALSEAQALIQQELVRLHKLEQDALDKVIPAETHWRNNQGHLQPQHVDDLLQTEQLQQQIRARVGTRQEGLQADAARVLRTLKDNHLPRSGTHDRMEAVASELDRLAREELEQIEPRLTEARKQSESPLDKHSPNEKGPLTDARKHQEEVKRTLGDLLQLLEPWSSTREVKGEAKSILQEQQRLNQETDKLGKETAGGLDPKKLTEVQRAERESAAEMQSQLAERTGELLQKLDRLAQSRSAADAEGKALAEAAKKGVENGASQKMQDAAKSLRENQLGRAGREQRDSIQAMEEVVKALEDRREEELNRLIKKMKEAEQKLARLAEQQDLLQKKAAQADQIADPAKRAEELKHLAREQEELQQQVQEMVRELSRLRAERADQALSQASGRMQQAGRRMDQGQDAQEPIAEALDRLNETRRELERERREVEEQLAREKLAQIADQVKRLKERQESLTVELARINREVLQKKEWTRPLRSSLLRLADAQKGLGDETEQMAKEKLKEAKVFHHLLTKSAEAMIQASERMQARLKRDAASDLHPTSENGLDLAAEQLADEETQHWQHAAARRIGQLLDALKPEPGMAQAAQSGEGGGQPGGNPQRDGQRDNLPPLAQLKALRALQQDVGERTKAFDRQHPEQRHLSKKEEAELRAIHQEQHDIADLFQQLTSPADPDGETK